MNPKPKQIKDSDLEEFQRYWECFIEEVISQLKPTIKDGKNLNDNKEKIEQLSLALEKSVSKQWQEKAEENFLKKYQGVEDYIRDYENNSRDIAQRWVKRSRVNFKPLKPLQVVTVSSVISLLFFLVFYTEPIVVGILLTIGTIIIFILLAKIRQKNWVKAKSKYLGDIKKELISERQQIEKEIITNE